MGGTGSGRPPVDLERIDESGDPQALRTSAVDQMTTQRPTIDTLLVLHPVDLDGLGTRAFARPAYGIARTHRLTLATCETQSGMKGENRLVRVPEPLDRA